MKMFAVVFAICCLATAQARPGYSGGGGGGGGHQLQGIPDLESYSKLQYPKYDLLELGEFSKGELPPATIVSNKEITIKIPQPYPVKVPHPVEVPVPVAKPYPVIQTKIVKVPHPVPYEVVKKIPVHIEVPKPYPVPVNEHHSSGGGGGYENSYSGGFGGHQSLSGSYGVPGQEQGTPLGEHEYEANAYGGDGSYDSDRSVGYATYEAPESNNNGAALEHNEEAQEEEEEH